VSSNLSPHPLLQQTPLNSLHRAAGAKLTAFSGWEMPLQFRGIVPEHHAVRQSVGMFDISHMGKLVLRLTDRNLAPTTLRDRLQRLLPSDLSRLQPGQALYTVLLDETGGVLDDLIVYDQGCDGSGLPRILLIVNAGTCADDRAWLASHLDLTGLELIDLTAAQALIALQGPQAEAKLQPFVTANLSEIAAFGHCETTILGQSVWIARTGYTGEDGFEVMTSPIVAKYLWASLQELGVTPCGLGARDTLRLEAAMALYGNELDRATSPLEAGLTWVVQCDRVTEFIGREALEQQRQAGLTRRLVGLQMQGRHIARHGYPVYAQGEAIEPIGVISSGAPSPTLGYPIALAYVALPYAKLGTAIEVEIRGKRYPATVVKKPFYRRSTII